MPTPEAVTMQRATDTRTTDDVALWHALHALECAYWHDVDRNAGRSAHEFYVPDGVMVVGHNRFEGREEIRKFYCWREQQSTTSVAGATTTRHLINNLYVESATDRSAKLIGIVSFYGGVAKRTAHPKPPILMTDLIAECVRDDDGRWRYRSHLLQPVFVSHESPLSLAIASRR
jgi:hypothetical protein